MHQAHIHTHVQTCSRKNTSVTHFEKVQFYNDKYFSCYRNLLLCMLLLFVHTNVLLTGTVCSSRRNNPASFGLIEVKWKSITSEKQKLF